ncbi:hypothetical protein U91I_02288 [alpha proteobacterium U9-1i]|nr:hypothetical protein U91I_02288 [alpha proteobacterium U9-1i]
MCVERIRAGPNKATPPRVDEIRSATKPMAITFFEHAALGFQVVRMDGVLTDAQLTALSQAHVGNRDWAAADAIHIVDEALDVSEVTYAHLDKLRALYRVLQASLDLHLVRRAAWVCPNPSAWSLLEYWLADRHSRDGQGSDVCLVASLAEASLLFDEEELATVSRWRGFTELHRI